MKFKKNIISPYIIILICILSFMFSNVYAAGPSKAEYNDELNEDDDTYSEQAVDDNDNGWVTVMNATHAMSIVSTGVALYLMDICLKSGLVSNTAGKVEKLNKIIKKGKTINQEEFKTLLQELEKIKLTKGSRFLISKRALVTGTIGIAIAVGVTIIWNGIVSGTKLWNQKTALDLAVEAQKRYEKNLENIKIKDTDSNNSLYKPVVIAWYKDLIDTLKEDPNILFLDKFDGNGGTLYYMDIFNFYKDSYNDILDQYIDKIKSINGVVEDKSKEDVIIDIDNIVLTWKVSYLSKILFKIFKSNEDIVNKIIVSLSHTQTIETITKTLANLFKSDENFVYSRYIIGLTDLSMENLKYFKEEIDSIIKENDDEDVISTIITKIDAKKAKQLEELFSK